MLDTVTLGTDLKRLTFSTHYILPLNVMVDRSDGDILETW